MSRCAIGIDLGGTSIKAALVEREKGLIRTTSCPTEAEEGPDHVLNLMADLARSLISQAPDETVEGIGIGSPGAINWERTTVTSPPNLPNWESINVRDALRERLGLGDLPVIVENDANVAGLGSAYYGAGRPHDSFIMVTLGTGVGGAIIYRNKIFRGSTGAAGEIGHMTINYEGPLTRFGIAGSIEAYVGQRFLSHYARYRLISRTDSRVHELSEDDDLRDVTPRMLYEAAIDGDEAAREVLAWAGHKLGCLLGSVINLLDIRVIVVGGGVSSAGDLILEPARKSMMEYTIPPLRNGVTLIREQRGNEVGILGAAQLGFDGDEAQV